MKKLLWVFILLVYVRPSVAQSEESSIQLRENIHLHLNKTTFFQGESIWFTAYVQDQNAKTISKTTKNLHVALSDRDGTVISKKTIYVENGIGIGDFELDTTFTDTHYILTAWTNYMRNFKDLKPFGQPITIVRETVREEVVVKERPFELVVWPEGGRLIAGAYNQLAFRLRDENGTGISQDVMQLRDKSGAVVRSAIATDADGYGRIGFMVDANGEYSLKFPQNGKENVTGALPLPFSGDIGIQVDNSLEDKLVIKLLGSKELMAAKSNEHYILAIFRTKTSSYRIYSLTRTSPSSH